MRAIATIARLRLGQVLRDRTTIFFVILLPLMLLLIIGRETSRHTADFKPRVAIASSNAELLSAVEGSSEFRVIKLDDAKSVVTAVTRRSVEIGVIVVGERPELVYDPAVPLSFAARAILLDTIQPILTKQTAQRFGNGALPDSIAPITTIVTTEKAKDEPEEPSIFAGGFNYQAPAQVILFTFITSIATSGLLVSLRRQGLIARSLAMPVRRREIIAGEWLGVFSIASFQALFIVIASSLFFHVEWGQTISVIGLVVVFALISAGVGVLAGVAFKTPEQAGAIGPAAGIAIGMLGGTMWPLEIVPSWLRTFGHVFPHAWAMDGFVSAFNGGNAYREIAILAGIAVVVGLASVKVFARSIAKP